MEKAYNRERLLPCRLERPRRHRATKQDTKIAAIESCAMHLRSLLVGRRFDWPNCIRFLTSRSAWQNT